MTAVASPPSLQSLPRLGWNSSNGVTGALDSMSADEVSRMFMPRKSVQRTNSSSSVTSSSSATSTATLTATATPTPSTNGATTNGEGSQWGPKKKATRGLWPSSKVEAVPGVPNARPQPITTNNAGRVAASTNSAAHQPSPIVPSQHVQLQQNGTRLANGQVQGNELPAVLALLPMNGTFERKQINVPFYPEVLRVGRQTNAKTVPTPLNGYFDSKVLSRQHAEVWADRTGKIFIRDVKSSNGTFVNGQRLSPENRDSEPHELREHDVLELGIDIVSEDQSKIVHHKVSAKVEFAGVPGSSTNVLDLNFGDIDPVAGSGLLPPPTGQQVTQRGRPNGSLVNGRTSGPPSVAGSQMSAMNQQRQLNFWTVPVNVDHLVKLLSTEMKQVRQQNAELGQTGTFLQSLLVPEEKAGQQSSPHDSQGQRQMNGRPKGPKLDAVTRFSDPPAPPPQQPLPEKPDAKTSPSDNFGHNNLKRSETERPKSGMGGSPTNPQSSQILNLVEALSVARKELETQGARVKHLETLLDEERLARESAEKRAHQLENGDSTVDSKAGVKAAAERLLAGSEISIPSTATSESEITPIIKSRSLFLSSSTSEASEDSLQVRLDILVAEMQEMKQQMEKYRQRADTAEDDANSSRVNLAEMIDRFRQGNAGAAAAAEKAVAEGVNMKRHANSSGTGSVSPSISKAPHGDSSSTQAIIDRPYDQHSSLSELTQQPQSPSRISANLQQALATLLRDSNGNQLNNAELMAQSAPYASMLGVVLLGVGLMAYLNSWQGREK